MTETAIPHFDGKSVGDTFHEQTATIAWLELQRFFAAGKVINVDSSLNLIAVASALHRDDKPQFERWMTENLVAPVTDDQARFWVSAESSVWAVVVSPWVLVQEPKVVKQ